jgi:hypothetical protein
VLSVRDALTSEQWADIWVHAQENGFRALRSQGFGRFTLSNGSRNRSREISHLWPFRGAPVKTGRVALGSRSLKTWTTHRCPALPRASLRTTVARGGVD